ncbi:MAG TPA: hypothetical protein VGX00_01010 [Thermoplasmata archaeon]|nr:hypothetical protein [Thermoplasmata archaeon]
MRLEEIDGGEQRGVLQVDHLGEERVAESGLVERSFAHGRGVAQQLEGGESAHRVPPHDPHLLDPGLDLRETFLLIPEQFEEPGAVPPPGLPDEGHPPDRPLP